MNALLVFQGHLILADTSAFDAGYRVGYVCGQVFGYLLFFLPALYCLYCLVTLRRPGTNVKCLLSLALALLTFPLCGLLGAVTRNHPELGPLGLIVGLGALGVMIAALVLAIIGLVEYYGPARQYTRGVVSAIIALVLCAIFGCLVMYGAFVGLTRPRQQAGSIPTQQPAAGEWLTFEDMNFRLQAPPKPWVQIEAKKLNTNSTVAFMNAKPETYFMVIAEKARGRSYKLDALTDVVTAGLRRRARSMKVIRETMLSRHGLDGVQIEAEAQMGGFDCLYQCWLCVNNGYIYQVIAYGRFDEAEQVRRKSEEMYSRFELLD